MQIFKKTLWMLKNLQQVRDFSAKHFYEDTEGRELIANSPYFDAEYYRRNDPDLDGCRDLAEHYLKRGGFDRLDPSESFCSDEYLEIHRDVWYTQVNPLVNFEKEGRPNGHEVSTLQLKEDYIRFPEGAECLSRSFEKGERVHKRAAVISCYFSGGVIPETLMILLRGIREVADNIILVGDCPVFPAELDKLEGLVFHAEFRRHFQYDFGSYKVGLAFARKAGILEDGSTDELVMMNDSCFGPVFPFSEAFRNMEKEPCDFWGMTGYRGEMHDDHLCSYFLVFRKPILDARAPDDFFERIQGNFDRYKVISKLETKLTRFLQLRGFYWQTYRDNHGLDLFYHPLTLLKEYRIPLLKKKSFAGIALEDLNEVLAIIREANPELAQYVKIIKPNYHDFRIPSVSEHRQTLPEKVRNLGCKAAAGEKVRVLFLTIAADPFPARDLFEWMSADPAFDAFVTAVPDLRLGEEEAEAEIMRQERLLLASGIPAERLIRVRPDDMERWPDVCEKMDIVCYGTARNDSSFRYLPKYAAGRDFLPILVNADVPDAEYDPRRLRLDAFRYMWKVFFISEKTLRFYQVQSLEGGSNGELSSDAGSAIISIKTALGAV